MVFVFIEFIEPFIWLLSFIFLIDFIELECFAVDISPPLRDIELVPLDIPLAPVEPLLLPDPLPVWAKTLKPVAAKSVNASAVVLAIFILLLLRSCLK